MMGVLGCRCTHRARGGDLGHGGGHREAPAICLGPRGGDPASLFSLTEVQRGHWEGQTSQFGTRKGCLGSVNTHAKGKKIKLKVVQLILCN